MKAKLKVAIALSIILTLAGLSAAALASSAYRSWRSHGGIITRKAAVMFLEPTLYQDPSGKMATNLIIACSDLQQLITDTNQAGNLNKANDPLIIDLRTKAEFDQCHIPGAVWIDDFGYMMRAQNLDKLQALVEGHIKETGNNSIVVYCHSGHKGAVITGMLGTLGFNVKDLSGGFNNGWQKLNYACVPSGQ